MPSAVGLVTRSNQMPPCAICRTALPISWSPAGRVGSVDWLLSPLKM